MKLTPVVSLCLLATTTLLTAEPSFARKALLLDSTLIERSDNIQIVVGQPEKYAGNPLFGEDRPWEPRFDNMYPNVIWDPSDQLYKCWYSPFLVEVEDWLGSSDTRKRWLFKRQSGLCYAYSADGIHWEKPALDILPFWGEPSNIVARDVHGIGVFRDERDPDANKRYKMFFVKQKRGEYSTIAVAASADGIHWGPHTLLKNVTVKGDTHNNAFWAPTLNRYVAFTRDWIRDNPGEVRKVRLVARIESEDFIHWSDPQVVLRGLEDHLQTYALPTFYYAGIYIGLPVIYNTREDRSRPELAWSKDTVTWHRVEPGKAFLPLSEKKGDRDWGCIYPAVAPIITDDGIRIYYAESDGLHFGERKGHFALATLRPDGFAAATPVDPARTGTIVTTPISFGSEEELLLTADIEPEGQVLVALIDQDGRELAEAEPLTGSFTARPVAWTTHHPQTPQALRLRFTLFRARLYSYDIVSKE